MRKLYIAVTMDQYELPLAVADSPTELARLMGTTVGTVLSSISHKRGRYRRVEYSEDEDEKEAAALTEG